MPSIWDLPRYQEKQGPAMDEARRRMVSMLGLLGAGLPTEPEMRTSLLYDSGKMDAMAGGPTRGEFKEAQREKVANVALGLLGAIQPVWHGSPHKFKRFDLSKIGTGEGAQAYGHGAYLAESPGVAKSYKDMAKDSFFIERPNEAAARLYDELEKISVVPGKVAVGSTRRLVDKDEFVKGVVSGMSDFNWWNFPAKARDAVEASYAGNLYESRLRWPDPAREAADPLGPQHFLDWDKPISQQQKEVQSLLGPYLPDDVKPAGQSQVRTKPIVDDLVLTADNVYELAKNPSVKRFIAKYEKTPNDPTVRRQLNYYFRDYPYDKEEFKTPLDALEAQWAVTAGEVLKSAQNKVGTGTLETQLLGAGIPGIRYLDAGSRGTGQGTHNYVVFDDALIEILRRNGVPIESLLD